MPRARLGAYFDFRGRASRIEYWRFQIAALLTLGISMTAALVLMPIVGRIGAIAFAPLLPMLLAWVAVMVRRLHDRGKSGWWLLVFLVLPTGLSAVAQATLNSANAMLVLLALLISLASLGVNLWGLIEIGFMRGAAFNRFGADPSLLPAEEAFT